MDFPYIQLALSKGAILLLTRAEYREGIRRGKAYKRALSRLRRDGEARAAREREAGARLDWIDEAPDAP